MYIQSHIAGINCSACVNKIQSIAFENAIEQFQLNSVTGQCSFTITSKEDVIPFIKELKRHGYRLKSTNNKKSKSVAKKKPDYLLLVAISFTLPLLLTHLPFLKTPLGYLHNPYMQLAFCLPVYIIGWIRIGHSGLNSAINKTPNMNFLIIMGATMALAYSLGQLWIISPHIEQLFFFEATASIITLVMLGHYFERYATHISHSAIRKLVQRMPDNAIIITFDDKKRETYLQVESNTLKTGDLVLIKSGDKVPIDCKVLSGYGSVDESMMSGESTPIAKEKKSLLIGGSLLLEGTIKAQATCHWKDSTMSHILRMIEEVQLTKPPIQQLADKISSVFVPVVILISGLVFLVSIYAVDLSLSTAVMRSVAVIVIACPCALGMATPAAVAIGMSIAARKGIFFKNARQLEKLRKIRKVVFDKTGTLTQNKLNITSYYTSIDDSAFKSIATQLEQHSQHPIALSIVQQWGKQRNNGSTVLLTNIQEKKGIGMQGNSRNGDTYRIGSFRILKQKNGNAPHDIYMTKNGACIGWIDTSSHIKKGASILIEKLKKVNILPILLSGDSKEKSEKLAKEIGINTCYAEKLPKEKKEIIHTLNYRAPTMMVGDGINDAPAIATASVGIAVSDASQLSIQTAQVVLTNKSIDSIYQAIKIGTATYQTIVENFVWALGYNLIAIPVAAMGFLTPTLAALLMGISDIILILNSLRLYTKKL